MTQLSLPLGVPEGAGDGGFLVGESNARAVHQLEHWAAWPVMAALLTGPRKSGKSLLARIMTAKSGGTLIDDADTKSETALFHAWNAAQADRRPLFLVASQAPPEWEVKLPDLRSRLAATPVLRIGPPDDALAEALLAHLFERHHLIAKPDLIGWLARRMERSHLAVIRIVDALEEDAHRRRSRRLSIPAARATLARAGLLVEPTADTQEA
jgi:chromosomal replication initiation ATPase DnaA